MQAVLRNGTNGCIGFRVAMRQWPATAGRRQAGHRPGPVPGRGPRAALPPGRAARSRSGLLAERHQLDPGHYRALQPGKTMAQGQLTPVGSPNAQPARPYRPAG